jgi:hypothetical protein
VTFTCYDLWCICKERWLFPQFLIFHWESIRFKEIGFNECWGIFRFPSPFLIRYKVTWVNGKASSRARVMGVIFTAPWQFSILLMNKPATVQNSYGKCSIVVDMTIGSPFSSRNMVGLAASGAFSPKVNSVTFPSLGG